MRKNESNRKRDEVEELLRAAQDELLLNISLDSHIASSSSSTLSPPSSDVNFDDDLDRRFQALKSKSKSVAIASEVPPSKSALVDDNSIFSRFDALKLKSNPSLKNEGPTVSTEEEESEDEDDQVEKLIQWAKDAARLDPSTSSDDEEEDCGEQQNQHPTKQK